MLNIYIIYDIQLWPFTVDKIFVLGNSLFGAVKLTKNAYFDNYKCCGYGIGFNARGRFPLSDGSGFGKNVIILGANMSSSLNVDNRKNKY